MTIGIKCISKFFSKAYFICDADTDESYVLMFSSKGIPDTIIQNMGLEFSDHIAWQEWNHD